jgi:hypothetical protein
MAKKEKLVEAYEDWRERKLREESDAIAGRQPVSFDNHPGPMGEPKSVDEFHADGRDPEWELDNRTQPAEEYPESVPAPPSGA